MKSHYATISTERRIVQWLKGTSHEYIDEQEGEAAQDDSRFEIDPS